MILFSHLSYDHPPWPMIFERSCYSSLSNTKWVPLGWQKKKKKVRCRGKWDWSRLPALVNSILGGRTERHWGKDNISERHERGKLLKRQHRIVSFWGLHSCQQSFVAKKQISCADIHKVWNQRMSSLQLCCLCFAVRRQFSQIITQTLCPLCLLQEWSF